jgi:hypothetical protein
LILIICISSFDTPSSQTLCSYLFLNKQEFHNK